MKKIVSALVMSVLLLFAAPASAWAQSNVTSLSAELNYTDISNKLTKIEKSLKSSDVTSADLSEDVKYIAATRMDLQDIKKNIESSLRFVKKKLDALGPEPEDGKEVPLTGGCFQLQSEGSELFVKSVEIQPIKEIPAELLK